MTKIEYAEMQREIALLRRQVADAEEAAVVADEKIGMKLDDELCRRTEKLQTMLAEKVDKLQQARNEILSLKQEIARKDRQIATLKSHISACESNTQASRGEVAT